MVIKVAGMTHASVTMISGKIIEDHRKWREQFSPLTEAN